MSTQKYASLVLSVLLFGVPFAFNKTAFADSSKRLTKSGLVVIKNAPEILPPTEVADFSAGCFWGVEEEFRKTPGVIATAAGFEGGHTKNPTYNDVSYFHTGHAETVSVEFDPKVTSYEKLLEVFWNLHDPTTVNRQGPDEGEQYRSVVFYHSDKQKALALASRDALQLTDDFKDKKIVTEIVPASIFTKASEHHQQYVEKGGHAACQLRRKI